MLLGLPLWSAFTLLFSRSDDADKPYVDVGGGSVPNGTQNSLARIPLRWMIRECFKCNTGIMFLSEKLREVGLEPKTLYPTVARRPARLAGHGEVVEKPFTSALDRFLLRVKSVKSRVHRSESDDQSRNSGTDEKNEIKGELEEVQELLDAISPAYDQLKISPAWWILEILPYTVKNRKRCVFCLCVMMM